MSARSVFTTPGSRRRAGSRVGLRGARVATCPGAVAPVVLACGVVTLILAIVASGAAWAQPQGGVTETFREANRLYSEERYDEAATLYDAIAESGFESADVQYNLGNARFKAGRLGHAVLAYERALELEPSHEDAAANLAFVQELLADRRAPVGGPLSRFFADAGARLTSRRLALLGSALNFILFGILAIRVLRGRLPTLLARTAVATAIILVFAGGVLTYREVHERGRVEAVVMLPEVGVRTGPGDDFVLEFRLHEGTKVRLDEERGEWSRVALEGTDLEGWMPSSAIERI